MAHQDIGGAYQVYHRATWHTCQDDQITPQQATQQRAKFSGTQVDSSLEIVSYATSSHSIHTTCPSLSLSSHAYIAAPGGCCPRRSTRIRDDWHPSVPLKGCGVAESERAGQRAPFTDYHKRDTGGPVSRIRVDRRGQQPPGAAMYAYEGGDVVCIE